MARRARQRNDLSDGLVGAPKVRRVTGAQNGLVYCAMNLILIIVILVLLFGGGGFWLGGPRGGGVSLGAVLLILLVLYLLGVLR